MKKILSIVASLFLAFTVYAKDIKHIIYLNNGEAIKGRVIEQVPDKSIKVRTTEGKIIEYKMSEVSKIMREPKPLVPEAPNGKHHGLDFSISTGYMIGVGDFKKTGIVPVEIGLGKQTSRYFYVGGHTGAFIGTNKGSNVSIPLALDTKIMFPGQSPVIPFIDLSLGYNFITGVEDIDEESKEQYEQISGEKYEGPSNGMFVIQLMPGIKVPISKSADYYLSAGYSHAFFNKGGNDGGFFSIKTGIIMHKNPNRPPRKRRLPVATRDHGFQWTMEAGLGFDEIGGGGDMIFGYKINPHFNIGLGFGYYRTDPFSYRDEYGAEIIYIKQDGSANISEYNLEGAVSTVKTYLRGVYRITDRRLSPFISCDAGIRLYKYDNDIFHGWENDIAYDVLGNPDKISYFAAPAVGISLRTTKNSYLELKGGYSFAPNILGQKVSTEIDNTKYYGSCTSTKMSYPFVTIGFTHTFGKKGDKR